MITFSSLSRKKVYFFVTLPRFDPRTCPNLNTIYYVSESHVPFNRGIRHELQRFCLPHVAVENVHAD